MAIFTLSNNSINFSLFASYSNFDNAVKGNTYHNLLMSSIGWVKWAKEHSTSPFTFTVITEKVEWGTTPDNLDITSISVPNTENKEWLNRIKQLFVEVTKRNSMLLCYADVTEVTGVYNKNGKEVKLPYQIVPTSGWYKYDLLQHPITFYDERKRPLTVRKQQGLQQEVVTSCPVLTVDDLQ